MAVVLYGFCVALFFAASVFRTLNVRDVHDSAHNVFKQELWGTALVNGSPGIRNFVTRLLGHSVLSKTSGRPKLMCKALFPKVFVQI